MIFGIMKRTVKVLDMKEEKKYLEKSYRILIDEHGNIIKLSRSEVERLTDLYFKLTCHFENPPTHIRIHGHRVPIEHLETALDIPF